MRIRPLTIDDQSFLWKALYYAIHVPPGEAEPSSEIVKEPDIRRYAIGWMKRPDDFGFAAILDEMPVGAAWLRCWSGDERGYGFNVIGKPEGGSIIMVRHCAERLKSKRIRNKKAH